MAASSLYQKLRELLTLCLPHTNPLCTTFLRGALELGCHFGSIVFNSVYLLPINRMEKPKRQINNVCAQCEPETMGIASLSNTHEQ